MKQLTTTIFSCLLTSGLMISHAQDCVLTCPANIVVKSDKGQDGAIVNYPSATASGNCGAISYAPASGTFFRLGAHSVIASIPSGQKCFFTITVTDNEPPVLSTLTLSRQLLWPASNKLRKVGVYYTTSDNAKEVKTEIAVSSNTTDGIKDFEIVNNHLVRLKASRLSDGAPRIYSITVTATDEAGNKTMRTTTISVSETMTAKQSS